MCTSIVVNRNKTIVGWNLDLLDFSHRVRPTDAGVFIEIDDPKEGWLPIFGANSRGDFAGLPTCWPYDGRSDSSPGAENVIMLNIDLLLVKKTFGEIKTLTENRPVCSVPGLTFMSALSDRSGNVLHIVPGQGRLYLEKPDRAILTNFSPFKQDKEIHPWMGRDRYLYAEKALSRGGAFDVDDCFELLRGVSQTVCPTVVSMVFDVTENTVFWCENREWNKRERIAFKPGSDLRRDTI